MRHNRIFELTLLSLLGTVMFGTKIAMASLPNIEPVSLLVVVYSKVLGRKALYPIYIYVFLDLLVWGIGLWNFNYIYVWLLLFILCRFFARMESPLGWAILTGAFGLGFGLLCAPIYCLSGGWRFGLNWWLAGIPFDVLHCVGNFFLVLVLKQPLTRLLSTLLEHYLY